MSKGWTNGVINNEVHVLPIEDLIAHLVEDCACGPTTEPVEGDGGIINWVVIHHSLDGREKEE